VSTTTCTNHSSDERTERGAVVRHPPLDAAYSYEIVRATSWVDRFYSANCPANKADIRRSRVTADAKLEILELFARYSQYVSDRRYDEWASLFADDGQMIGVDGIRGTGPKEMDRYIRAAHQGWTVKQVTVNPLIMISDDGQSATSTSDWVVYRKIDGEFVTYAMGRYQDEVRKTLDGWRIYRRYAVPLGEALPEGVA
jgi:3-phenylpropionate/cinnamic acid dioxygenase small subunit